MKKYEFKLWDKVVLIDDLKENKGKVVTLTTANPEFMEDGNCYFEFKSDTPIAVSEFGSEVVVGEDMSGYVDVNEIIPLSEAFYLQDSRSYVGNDMLFWALEGKGYTTDLRKAQVYSREQAVAQYHMRNTDIPWPKAYIDERIRPVVDVQNVVRVDALGMAGIVVSQQKRKKQVYRCNGCNRFMSEVKYFTDQCPHCGTENRP